VILKGGGVEYSFWELSYTIKSGRYVGYYGHELLVVFRVEIYVNYIPVNYARGLLPQNPPPFAP